MTEPNLIAQATVFRLYPNEAQAGQMRQWIGAARALWNHLLWLQKQTYETEKRFLSAKELEKARQAWEAEEGCDWRKAAVSHVRQRIVKELDKALRDFLKSRKGQRKGRKLGFPRFKKKRPGGTFYLANTRFQVEDGRVAIDKLGSMRTRNGRPLGEIKGARVRLQGGRWSIAIQHEASTPPRVLGKPSEAVIGVDVGVKALAARSDGKCHEAPRPLRRLERRLKRLSRRMSARAPAKFQPASRRFRVMAGKVARLQGRIADIRKDAQHVASIRIVAKAAVVGIETLNVKGMARGRLAKSVHDAGMAELHRQIEYKASWHGREVVKLAAFERSTGVCPRCGEVGPKLPLHVRRWTCAGCGAKHERDVAAAEHIAAVALREVGRVTPEPAAIAPPTRGERGDQAWPARPVASVPLDEPRSPEAARPMGAAGEPADPLCPPRAGARIGGATRRRRRRGSSAQLEIDLSAGLSPTARAGLS